MGEQEQLATSDGMASIYADVTVLILTDPLKPRRTEVDVTTTIIIVCCFSGTGRPHNIRCVV